MESKIGMHKIVWNGEPHPEFIELVQKEIDELHEGSLRCAADLVFHDIWLDDDPTGPCICLSGKSGDTLTFYAEYYASPAIVTLDGWSRS